MARWLLEHGADVNKADDAGETPLMTAAGSARPDLAELLLSQGADVAVRRFPSYKSLLSLRALRFIRF